MRIAVISPFDPHSIADLFYNPEEIISTHISATSVQNIVRGLVKFGHHVTIITACVGNSQKVFFYDGENIRAFVIQSKRGMSMFGLNVYPKIRKIIKEHLTEFDILHSHWTSEYAYSLIPFSAQKPCFCSVRDWVPFLMRTKRSLKNKVQMHILLFFFTKVMNNQHIIKVANSLYTSRCIKNYLQTDSVPLIPNPVNSQLLIDSKKYEAEHFTFISIAQSLSEKRKNFPTLLKAFALLRNEYPTVILKLIGEGGMETFKTLSSDNDFYNNIEFLGKVSHQEVINQIDKSSVLVHPAYEETFGNIFLEAAARNIPSIGGYDAGAVAEVLDYGRAGCLCDIQDAVSLYRAMRLLIEDVNYRLFITRNAHQRVSKIYSDIEICRNHISLYRSKLTKNEVI